MNQERIFQLIKSPLVTEKTNRIADKCNQYSFKVLNDANKLEIKKTIETLYQVEVLNVTTINVEGKKKRFKQINGKRKNWKKAMITVKQGQQINIIESA